MPLSCPSSNSPGCLGTSVSLRHLSHLCHVQAVEAFVTWPSERPLFPVHPCNLREQREDRKAPHKLPLISWPWVSHCMATLSLSQTQKKCNHGQQAQSMSRPKTTAQFRSSNIPCRSHPTTGVCASEVLGVVTVIRCGHLNTQHRYELLQPTSPRVLCGKEQDRSGSWGDQASRAVFICSPCLPCPRQVMGHPQRTPRTGAVQAMQN